MKYQSLNSLIEQYKQEARRTAARGTAPTKSATPKQSEPPQEIPTKLPSGPHIEQPPAFDRDVTQLKNPQMNFPQFIELTPQTGSLRVQATAARNATPVGQAQVRVSKNFTDGMRVFATGATDESGILDNILLPAPDKNATQALESIAPYALYDIEVSHPDYAPQVFLSVPIFGDVKSIQTVEFY